MTDTQGDTLLICGAAAVNGIQNFGDELLQDIYTRWAKEARPDLRVVVQGSAEAGNFDSRRPVGVGSIGGGYLAERATERGEERQRYARFVVGSK